MGNYELASSSDNQDKDNSFVNVTEPVQTQHVRHLRRRLSELTMDFVLAIVPWLFVGKRIPQQFSNAWMLTSEGLAIAAQLQHHHAVSRSRDRIQRALLLGPTVFPIVFAALCGHFMKLLALYKIQSGLRMKVSNIYGHFHAQSELTYSASGTSCWRAVDLLIL